MTMTLFPELPKTGSLTAHAAGAKSRRSMQRNGLRYGPADNDLRGTPSALFRKVQDEFAFTLDVCATAENAKCERFYTAEDNGLAQPWAPERCWMNPPYSSIEPWTVKAVAEAAAGALVVGLLPVRTDLGWFHRDVLVADAEIRFLRGRMRFEQNNGTPMWATAPHPSMLVVWWPKADPPKQPSGRSSTCARCGEPAVMWSGAWVLEDGWIGWCSKPCQNAWLRGDKACHSRPLEPSVGGSPPSTGGGGCSSGTAGEHRPDKAEVVGNQSDQPPPTSAWDERTVDTEKGGDLADLDSAKDKGSLGSASAEESSGSAPLCVSDGRTTEGES